MTTFKKGDVVRDKDLQKFILDETLKRTKAETNFSGNYPAMTYRHNLITGNRDTDGLNELTVQQWLERCSGEVITTKQGDVKFNKDSITIGEYELPNDLVKKIAEKLVD